FTFVVAVNTAPDQLTPLGVHKVDDQSAFSESESFNSSASPPTSCWEARNLPFIGGAKSEVHNEVRPILYFRHTSDCELRAYGVFNSFPHNRAVQFWRFRFEL